MSFDFDSLARKPHGKSSQKPSPDFNFGNAQASQPDPQSAPPNQDFQQVSFNPSSKSSSNSSTGVRVSSGSVHKPGASRAANASTNRSSQSRQRGKGQKGLDTQTITLAAGGGVLLLVIVIALLSFSGVSSSRPGQLSSAQKNQVNQYINQGMNYNNSGDYQRAAAAFKKAYELDPTDGYAPSQLAIIYRTKINDPAQLQIWEQRNDQIITGAVGRLKGQSADYWDKKNKR